jgi:hypothetical protein
MTQTVSRTCRKIVVFGHANPQGYGFKNPKKFSQFSQFIKTGIFEPGQDRRYHHTQRRKPDEIVLSYGGVAYGRFTIECRVETTEQDRARFPVDKVIYTYLVRSSTLYERPVPLAELGIPVRNWPSYISEEKLREIEARAGRLEHYR